MFTFIHAADIHLDSPLLGLERYEGAPVEEIRGATRRALENLVQLAIEEAVQFVVIAGDLYDGDWRDAGTGLYFVKQMVRLRTAKIRVFVIAGNHDAQNKMTRELRFPENVTVFSSRKAATVLMDELGVAVHGQSYATGDVRDNLAGAYPTAVSGAFNIGLLHTCGTGAAGHEPYAPCALAELTGRGYQYWALGHVHTRQALCEEPPVVYPGNVQGRHIRETGPRGCELVRVDERHGITREFMPLDVLRWYVCEVDATGAANGDAVIDRFAERLRELIAANAGYTLAIRVRVSGATGADRKLRADRVSFRDKLQSVGVDLGGGAVWIEKVVIDTRTEAQLALPEGPVAELKAYLNELRGGGVEIDELLRDILPLELWTGCEGDDRQKLLDDVEALLMERLMGTEAAQ